MDEAAAAGWETLLTRVSADPADAGARAEMLTWLGGAGSGVEPQAATAALLAVLEGIEAPAVEIVTALLKAGAGANGLVADDDGDGRTGDDGPLRLPLQLAALHGSVELVRVLVAGGADVCRAASFGLTALHDAASCNYTTARQHKKYAAVAEELLAAGAEVDAADETGATPLVVACRAGSHLLAGTLLSHGADVGGGSHSSAHIPLIAALLPRATLVERQTLVKLLVRKCADVNARRRDPVLPFQGSTPLECAIFAGHIDAAEFLAARGAEMAPNSPARKLVWPDLARILAAEPGDRRAVLADVRGRKSQT
ncbi:uncharacterized protein AMSG_09906 [Thecamonas trahens ATCC 50062]|uniref:Uncharacterized protein n=1 Tax=Thecamonas trahens ATCC 50062 TaxID=461836 RepID=A0A0L0DPA4_THETB|nr:hypothetical protein AMSG_09906 [Thecamonas trahens ATCC 50062]KNC54129.1 hypothetical protein AMSG_09906 [Thecamonas trahens ATCC 50062]|eukprot:XP_013753951.1 hypothetical protein AMSG_09906 [Thecamonas trahens ATCC 50062]